MKKLLILFVALALTFTLAGCSKETELPTIPETVDMDAIDDYLGRPDAQYVDLRNSDDKFNAGYISGFEMIPFFDYLENTDILVRTDGDWTFAAADIVSQASLRALFNEDKTIFLMCGSGTRAGFVMAALESLGYTNVINVGGIADYEGDNLVAGDGSYNLAVVLPIPTVVDMDNIDMYLGRNDVQYVDLRDFDDKMAAGYIAGFEMIPFFDYLENTGILVKTDGDWTFAAEDIHSQSALRELFNEDKTIFLMCGSGTRAGYVMAALESLGYTNVVNVGGLGSYTGDNLVSGDGVYKLEVVVPGSLTPGVYFGSSTDLYTAVVVINSAGGIQSVFFDAVTCATDTDADDIKDSDCSTKQTLGFAYNMKLYGVDVDLEWFEQANELAAAIVAAQGWSDDWAMTAGAFDAADQDVIDDVAGVTVHVTEFLEAFEDAIDQATPAS